VHRDESGADAEGGVDRKKVLENGLPFHSARYGEQGERWPRGGAWFGVVFGLSYALLFWVSHARALNESAGVLPILEIIVGSILFVAFWALIGFLAANTLVRWALLLGALAGFLTPWVIWFAKTLQENWIRFIERGDWDIFYRSGTALHSRLFFIGIWGIGIGLFTVLLERLLLSRAWDFTSASGKITLRSISVFLVCLPLSLLFANVSNDMLHKEYHEIISGTYENLSSLATQEIRRPFITWRYGSKEVDVTSTWEWPQGDFTLYLVDYDSESMGKYYFDAVYDDGSVVRCMGGSSSVQFCGNLTDTLQQMMETIVVAAWDQDLQALLCQECDPYIGPDVANELADMRQNFSGGFRVYQEAHYDSTIAVVARFESGYRLRCYFRGDEPIVVEKCSGFLER